jgi:hypothetical protein
VTAPRARLFPGGGQGLERELTHGLQEALARRFAQAVLHADERLVGEHDQVITLTAAVVVHTSGASDPNRRRRRRAEHARLRPELLLHSIARCIARYDSPWQPHREGAGAPPSRAAFRRAEDPEAGRRELDRQRSSTRRQIQPLTGARLPGRTGIGAAGAVRNKLTASQRGTAGHDRALPAPGTG